jgi:nitroimidazol reductase NimA-like FMN-containing flavoprotein (pyridoxamine 5'-phosphate oxidase superfamily)
MAHPDSPYPVPRPLTASTPVPLLDLSWEQAVGVMAAAENYHVVSVGPDGDPHIVPVLGVWVDGALAFNSQVMTRKARHLALNPSIAVSIPGPDRDFTLEGRVAVVDDPATLQRIADAFARKYAWWHPVVVDGRFVAEGDVPRRVFRVEPVRAFGFGKESGFSGTRWDFDLPGRP